MAKKGGKKGKGKKGGGGGTSMTPHETMMAYQMDQINQDNLKYASEIKLLKMEKERLTMQQRAIDSQTKEKIRVALNDDKKLETEAAQSKDVSGQEVRDRRSAQIQLNRDLEAKVDDTIRCIAETEAATASTTKEVTERKRFFAKDYTDLTDKVQLLEKRLSEMIFQFDEMRQNLNAQVENSRVQEDERAQNSLEKQRLRAIEHAIERLPPQQAQELRENRWLLSEAGVHREQIKVLYGQVEALERRNLDLMNIVYTKRMDRLGMLMKSAKMKMPSDARIDELTGQMSLHAADPAFTLSEIDLNCANFKAIQDPNPDPSKVFDFEQNHAMDFRLKTTQSTDMMNKVAGIMVQGHHENVMEPTSQMALAQAESGADGQGPSVWPVAANTLRETVGRETGGAV